MIEKIQTHETGKQPLEQHPLHYTLITFMQCRIRYRSTQVYRCTKHVYQKWHAKTQSELQHIYFMCFYFCILRKKIQTLLQVSHLLSSCELVIDTKVNFALASLLMSMGMDICGLSKIQWGAREKRTKNIQRALFPAVFSPVKPNWKQHGRVGKCT